MTPEKTGLDDGLVATTDVSVLYPLPATGGLTGFLAPDASGAQGTLLPAEMMALVLGGASGMIERTRAVPASGYADLRLVGFRVDPCSARGLAEKCPTEVRAVFQALHEAAAGDPEPGIHATDGAVHVAYAIPHDEFYTMFDELLALKKANGGLGLHELAPHPILVQQGLGGTFAAGLSAILLAHLGGERIVRITTFDHNFDLDGDGWTFSIFERTAGTPLVVSTDPGTNGPGGILGGTNTHVALAESSAFIVGSTVAVDAVEAMAASDRPATPDSAMTSAFDSAARVLNPNVHTSETTSCTNCHLAEGAMRIGQELYGLAPAKPFTHERSLARKDERTSVTNLHAFGYLGRRVSIMQRTANESVVVAATMEKILTK